MGYISKLIYSGISNQFELKHVDNEPNVCTREPFGMEALKFHVHFQTQSVYFDPE